MKKNIVILILTAVCLFEFVFVLTASRENSFSGENDISEGNAREEEAKEDIGKAAVQEDIDTDFQATERKSWNLFHAWPSHILIMLDT